MSLIRSDPPDGTWWTIGSSPSYLLQPLLLPDANFNASSFKTVYMHSYTPALALTLTHSPILEWEQFIELCRREPTNCTVGGIVPPHYSAPSFPSSRQLLRPFRQALGATPHSICWRCAS
jgi:hypothetical protein